jgi:DNA-binding transcriptional LysR family regulator
MSERSTNRSQGDPILPANASRDLVWRLRRTNLNLLPICHELLRTCNVTKTAEELGLSQPAVSQSLGKLRQIFGDELIISLGRDPYLSERGRALLMELDQILREADQLIQGNRPFNPAVEELKITIATADFVIALIGPSLIRQCADLAPISFADLEIRDANDLTLVDFLICPRPLGERFGKRVHSMPLWRDRSVLVCRKGNPLVGDRVTQQQFEKLNNVVFDLQSKTLPGARTLIQPASNFQKNAMVSAPDFLAVAYLVETTDYVALLPEHMLPLIQPKFDIRQVEADFLAEAVDVDAFWSEDVNSTHGHAWFRDILLRSLPYSPSA